MFAFNVFITTSTCIHHLEPMPLCHTEAECFCHLKQGCAKTIVCHLLYNSLSRESILD